jgi:hypothetical protein
VRRLALIGVLIAIVLGGCGEDTETTTLPTGLELEVEVKNDEQDQIKAYMDALYEQVDYTDEVEQCGRDNVDDLLTPEVLERFADLPERERQQERVRLGSDPVRAGRCRCDSAGRADRPRQRSGRPDQALLLRPRP